MTAEKEGVESSEEVHRPLVLIVDDDKFNRHILAEFLKEMGFDVITASDGMEGWERYIEYLPELVISDLNMPQMDGIALLSQIKKHNKNQVVFLVTGYYDQDQLAGDTDYYPDVCLNKPFTIADLQSSIISAFGYDPTQ